MFKTGDAVENDHELRVARIVVHPAKAGHPPLRSAHAPHAGRRHEAKAHRELILLRELLAVVIIIVFGALNSWTAFVLFLKS
jgi:hypothetical protein